MPELSIPESSMPESAPIAVAMSGGVDSSTVAALLVRQGHKIVGMTMQLWNQRRLPELAPETSGHGRCCSLDDVYDARRVAEQVGIPYYVVNFEKQFEEQAVQPFVDEYLAGRTPVPRVRSATTTSNSIASWKWLTPWAHTRSPPATTRACDSTRRRAAISFSALATRPRTRRISSSA